ncbi:hypothetical protein N2152v2_009193 [Parachlorella kessleri]
MELEHEKAEAQALKAKLAVALAAAAGAQAQRAASDAELAAANNELAEKTAGLSALSLKLAAEQAATQLAMERAAEADSLRQQLVEAATARTAQEEEYAAELQAKEKALADAVSEVHKAQEELQAKEAEAQAFKAELAGARDALQRSDAQLQGAKRQLQYTEAELHSIEARLQAREDMAEALADAREQLQELHTGHEATVASLRSEIAHLEAAQQQHLATMAELQQQKHQSQQQGSAASAAESNAMSPRAGSVGASPAFAEIVDADLHMPRSPDATSLPTIASATVYNVMLASPTEDDPAARQQVENFLESYGSLVGQVLSLQDKLAALQQAHEALLADYSMVTEQLAARQAEVQLARLSPESAQLKQQVAQLQSQVLSLQQELFASRSFTLPNRSPSLQASPLGQHLEGVYTASNSPSLSPGGPASQRGPPSKEGGRKLKRSFTRAASTIGRAVLGIGRQKSSASLGAPGECASRESSCSEAMSIRSYSVSPTALGLSMIPHRDNSNGRGAHGEAEALALRQQVQEQQQLVAQLEGRLVVEKNQQQLLQATVMQQGEDLTAARDALIDARAELEILQLAWRQLTDMQGTVTKVDLPEGANHAKCREAVDMLFRQVWKERMTRQKAEARLEQQSLSRRSTTMSEASAGEEAMQSLQAEVAAADSLSVQLQKAKSHQLQLQQRLQALQLQIAKQNALLESARGSPSPRALRRLSPSKDMLQLHSSLKLAEDRMRETETKLAAAERELTQLKRRERGMGQAVAQAAESRKRAEKRHEQARENWSRKLSAKQQELRQMETRLHATTIAQKELLNGLLVLEALLHKNSETGEGRSRKLSHATPRSTTADSQEALKQISWLLRTANTHLQILSPQHSDCMGQEDESSPRTGSAQCLETVAAASVGVLADKEPASLGWELQGLPTVAAAAERSSDPAEPASPRVALGFDAQEERSEDSLVNDAHAIEQIEQGMGRASLDDVLQAILGSRSSTQQAGEGVAAEGPPVEGPPAVVLAPAPDNLAAGLVPETAGSAAQGAGQNGPELPAAVPCNGSSQQDSTQPAYEGFGCQAQ